MYVGYVYAVLARRRSVPSPSAWVVGDRSRAPVPDARHLRARRHPDQDLVRAEHAVLAALPISLVFCVVPGSRFPLTPACCTAAREGRRVGRTLSVPPSGRRTSLRDHPVRCSRCRSSTSRSIRVVQASQGAVRRDRRRGDRILLWVLFRGPASSATAPPPRTRGCGRARFLPDFLAERTRCLDGDHRSARHLRRVDQLDDRTDRDPGADRAGAHRRAGRQLLVSAGRRSPFVLGCR